jgi:hypothetical protein
LGEPVVLIVIALPVAIIISAVVASGRLGY